MIVLAGASASGKTEVAKLLAAKYGITKIITTTTRDKRVGEVDKRDYFFITKEEFEKKIEHGDFVEYTFYNGNLYGSTKDQIAPDKCVVIDPAGLRSYIALNDPSIITFYLETDEETRIARMKSRGDDLEKIKSRIENDRIAFRKDNIAKVDYVIDNSSKHTLEEIAEEIYSLYMSKK
ncbi:MAG: AAA family ATPase [Bacilli bacterium]|nr:AAA family ATPase [Bacilli bacterium]